MDWDNVRVFLAVARCGQFVAAARRLRIDRVTVSRRIAALEASLGARLFHRQTAGERFLGAAEQMETAFLHAQAEIGDIDVELTGSVRIGAPDGFSTCYLLAAFRDFLARHPGILIQLVPMPQVIPLARREVDIVVVLNKPEAGRFVARKLADYSLGVYASAAYLETRKPPRAVADLTGRRLIGYVEEHGSRARWITSASSTPMRRRRSNAPARSRSSKPSAPGSDSASFTIISSPRWRETARSSSRREALRRRGDRRTSFPRGADTC